MVCPSCTQTLRKILDNGLSAEINGAEYNGVLSDTKRVSVINIQVPVLRYLLPQFNLHYYGS
jgi:hypothetical protein